LYSSLSAQSFHPVREKTVSFSKDTLQLDTLSLQNEMQFYSDTALLSNDAFYIDYAGGRVALKDKSLAGKPLKVKYAVLPFNFAQTYSHKSFQEKGFTFSNAAPYIYKPLPEQQDVFGYSTLNRSGSFTRGISFGNNQDLVVNSFVDIQLSGKIAPDIEVLASLNDRNIPIQPEGTTAQIQNFDQKFISVTLPRQKVMLGDLQLTNQPDNYYLKYNKKVQGITAQSSWNIKQADSGFTSVTGSLTKGKWQRQTFNGIEGNQGPYRLNGADGELYVIIVAGTEKIYINGELMKRGEQNDYKIDYNTGELVFTPARLITKYDRIIVEFQYADRNYQRYLLHAYTGYKVYDWLFNFNAYHEQDNSHQPIFATLRPQDRQALAKVGDSIQYAFAQSGDSVAFSGEKVLYKKKDTAGYKGIFVFSTNKDSAHFQVSFSYVGQGSGNYRQARALANGKVYQWLLPKNGIPQGDYEPVIKLVAPQKQQMFTLGTIHPLGQHGRAGIEGALSVRDLNTISNKDDGDNAGWAGRVFAENEFALDSSKKSLKIKYRLDFDHRDKKYTEVERSRSVEFNRIWNRQLQNPADQNERVEENLGTLTANLFNNNKFSLANTASIYRKSNYFNGLLENPVLRINAGKFAFLSSAEITLINDTRNADSFRNRRTEKYTADLSRSLKFFRLGVGGTQEQSRFIFNGQQYLNSSSFKYDEVKAYLANETSSKNLFGLEVNQRRDYSPFMDKFSNTTIGRNLITKLYLLNNTDRQLKLDFKYRNAVTDTAPGVNAPKKIENTYLTRVEYLLNLLKGALNTSSNIEISTGRELKRDFVYVQVAKGQGTHTWNDYNHNGLKEFNEFETAPFKDLGEYIRVIIPSSQYQNVLSNQYQQSIKLQPGFLFKQDTKPRVFAARFSDVASFSVLNKLQTDPTLARLNPFYTKINDTQLISTSSLLRNVVYFNRTSPEWGADYTYNATGSKTFLVSGFDSRHSVENTVNLRWNLNSQFVLEPLYTFTRKSFNSDYFNSKDFIINYHKQGALLTWQLNQRLRFNMTFYNSTQKNVLSAPFEHSVQNDGGLESRYNLLGKGTISARFDYINIRYNYDPNSPIAYEILQGLRPGGNYTWNASWNQKLQNSLQLTFTYEGRKSEGSKTVNIGRANVTWFF
jgi:hypothetical protein